MHSVIGYEKTESTFLCGICRFAYIPFIRASICARAIVKQPLLTLGFVLKVALIDNLRCHRERQQNGQ